MDMIQGIIGGIVKMINQEIGKQTNTPLEQYIAWGFVWDEEKALEFSKQKLECIADEEYITYSKKTKTEVLDEVLDEVLNDTGELVCLPLSGGLDSRALLASYLSNYSKKSILCITFGDKESNDVVSASALCKKHGVEHVWLNSDVDVVFDLEELASEIRNVWELHGTYALAESVAKRKTIKDISLKNNMTVLTGWSGVPVGSKLKKKIDNLDQERQLAMFVNNVLKGWPPVKPYFPFNDAAYLKKFISGVRSRVSPYCQISDYEMAHFLFPDNLRVQGGVHNYFPNAVTPYAETKWLAHCYGQAVDNRVGRIDFRKNLVASFPGFFSSNDLSNDEGKKEKNVLHRLFGRGYGMVKRKFWGGRICDIKNESLISAYFDSERSLRERDLPELKHVFSAKELAVANGGLPLYRYMTRVISIEAHLRAGTLGH